MSNKTDRKYWKDKFHGELPVLELPSDYSRPIVKTNLCNSVHFSINSRLFQEMKYSMPLLNPDLFVLLLSSVNALFCRYTMQEDIIIGSPCCFGEDSDSEHQIYSYDNILALRTTFNGTDKFETLVSKVQQTIIGASYHRKYPFDRLIGDLELPFNASRNPLFDVMLILNSKKIDISADNVVGIHMRPHYVYLTSRYDIVFVFNEFKNKEEISVDVHYNTDLFKRDRIERLCDHYKRIVESITMNVGSPINELDYLTDEEKYQLTVLFNNTSADYPKDRTISDLFEKQVARTPDRIAVVGPSISSSTDKQCNQYTSLTYRQLMEKSENLAQLLIEKGVKPGGIIGIQLERSIEMIIAILGILKADCAYLPIDEEYPSERKKYILEDSGTKVLLTSRKIVQENNLLGSWDGRIILLDLEESNHSKTQTIANKENQPVANCSSSTSLAYVIYTSGSTGSPKGVMIQQYSIVNLAFSQRKYFKIDECDRILLFSSICFDASVEQIFITLFFGACLIVVDKNTLLNKNKFENLIEHQSVTHLHTVPSFLNFINIKQRFKLKRIISGGDVCPFTLAKKMSSFCDFVNEYGPTETTVTSIEMKYNDAGEVLFNMPIGKPINNTRLYVLDKWQKNVPVGIPGELYIGGDGVALGYLKKPELTAERFICLSNGDRVYRTGDLVRWLPDGNIEFMGRIDYQVKIRGFRIELGEIESRLREIHKVKDAVVLIKNDNNLGYKYLCAYIAYDGELNITMIRTYLSKYLPIYMIPSYYVRLDKMPLTPSKKVDRSKLSLCEYK